MQVKNTHRERSLAGIWFMPRSVVINIQIHGCVWGSLQPAALTMARCCSEEIFFPGLLKVDRNQEINLIIIIWFVGEEGMAERGPRYGTEATAGPFHVLQQHQRSWE